MQRWCSTEKEEDHPTAVGYPVPTVALAVGGSVLISGVAV